MSYALGLRTLPRVGYQGSGHYGRGLVHIGDGGAFGTGLFADIQGELSQVNGEVKALNTELFNKLPATTTDPKFQFYSGAWRPFAEEFQDFRDKLTETSFGNLFRSMSPVGQRGLWKDLQEYRTRLQAMWEAANKAGFQLVSPKPTDPKRSDFDHALDPLRSLFNMLKLLVYIAIGVGAGWLLISAISEARKP